MLIGETVYLIMYNYSGEDYSVVKVVSSLDTAITFIKNEHDSELNLIVKNVKSMKDVPKYVSDNLYVCHIINGNYSNFELCDLEGISQFVIVPMKIG